MNFGKRLKELRKKKRVTQKELAAMLFVSDKAVSSWEAGRTEPSLDLLVKLGEILDCSVSYLLYGDVNRSGIETEIKIKLSEEEFRDLELYFKNNAKYLNCLHHIDTYYQPMLRKFIHQDKISEWLRIGVRGNKNILNYKNWYDDYCDEYEVEIDDVESLEKIFKALDLEKIAVVDKIRKTYFYLDKYEVALDKVENLGYFIEIEIKKYDKDLEEEFDALLKVAKEIGLNLSNRDKRGYPYYLLDAYKRKELGEGK